MDEVLEQLGATLISQDGNEAGRTNFEGLYKNWGKLNNQEQRRKDLLENQKDNRNSILDNYRGVVELVEAVEGSNIFQDPKALYRPQLFVAGFTRKAYSKVLMLSEWMIEKPGDFHENWYVLPCPKGARTLVVASQGITKLFSKFGQFRSECYTALPGGCPGQPGRDTRRCVLDCFYVESTKTMYILDLLGWNSQHMGDGEAEFRHYWLQTQLEEIPEIKTLTKKNKLIFKILPKVPCDPKSFDEFMMKIPHFPNYSPKLDGLLFYHKKAHYFSGQTPLVGWLYPFMVPEVIGSDVKVNPAYMLEKPENYVDQAHFIQKFEEKAQRLSSKKKKNESMDVTPLPSMPSSPMKSPKPSTSKIIKDSEMLKLAEPMEDASEKSEKAEKAENEEKAEKME